MKIAITTFGLIVFAVILQANSAFAEQNLIFHGKNVVESPPEFAGTVLHFMINNDKATVLHFGEKGLEIIRMNVQPSETCIQTQSTACYDGEVTDVKNPQVHQVGDKVSFTIDFANKKQIATPKSGPMEGMSIVMNIERMNVKSDESYTLAVTRQGGFAGFAPKTMTFDSSTGMITMTEGESEIQVPLEDKTIQEIDHLFKKSKLLNLQPHDYSPNSGAADYFSYGLVLNQGIFHNEYTWTDASDETPEILKQLQQKVWSTGEDNKPIPVEPMPTLDMHIQGLAREFIKTAPTFAFDGMEDTLSFGSVTTLESNPIQYSIEASFTSSHGGFGDRTDQVVTEALTPHKMTILISENEVISAVTDGEWDEINNQYVIKAPN